jgi:Flp pilus assembly pilin Flp
MGRSVRKRSLIQRTASAEAATAVEYAIMIALVAAAIIAIVLTLGLETAGLYERASTNLDAASSG